MNKILNLLSRKTDPKRKFIPEIDGLRFFAIFTVMIFHFITSYNESIFEYSNNKNLINNWVYFLQSSSNPFQFDWIYKRLDLGVKVFFAISGFILSIPFIKSKGKINLKKYYYNRLIRIEPPYIITLILFYLVHVVVIGEDPLKYSFNLFLGLTYSHVFVTGYFNPINPVTWSLETEVQFYILIPFLFLFFYRLRKSLSKIIFFIVVFLFSVYLRTYFLENQIYSLSNSVISYFSNFCIGIFFAFYFLKKSFNLKSSFHDVLGLVSILLMIYFYKPQFSFANNLFFNLSVFIFFNSVFAGKFFNWLFTRKILYTIGGMCYTIYLIHFAFFKLIVPQLIKFISIDNIFFNFSLVLLIAFLVTIIVSAIFFILFEKPFMYKNWPNKFVRFFKLSFEK